MADVRMRRLVDRATNLCIPYYNILLTRVTHEIKNLRTPATTKLLKDNGIEMHINEANMFSIFVTMKGPEGTPYQGGIFRYKLEAPDNYP